MKISPKMTPKPFIGTLYWKYRSTDIENRVIVIENIEPPSHIKPKSLKSHINRTLVQHDYISKIFLHIMNNVHSRVQCTWYILNHKHITDKHIHAEHYWCTQKQDDPILMDVRPAYNHFPQILFLAIRNTFRAHQNCVYAEFCNFSTAILYMYTLLNSSIRNSLKHSLNAILLAWLVWCRGKSDSRCSEYGSALDLQ